MGIGSFVLGGLLLLGYVALTPRVPHHVALELIDAGAIAGHLVVIGPVGSRSLTTGWRDAFFFGWSVSTIAVIAAGVGLDGGGGSPLACLLVLPVLFGGLLYRRRAVLGLAVIALGFFGMITYAGQPVSGARSLATAVMIGVAGAISVTASMNRHAWEQERTALTEELHAIAAHDGLTGCLNYRAFHEALASEVARSERYGQPFCIVLADLDGFKAVNDQYGHGAGDATLKRVALAMTQGLRPSDRIGRIGGDEFAVILPHTKLEDCGSVVERIQRLTRTVESPVAVTLSFGVATWQGPGDSRDELLARADIAVYDAKRRGRDRVVIGDAPDTGSRDQPRHFAAQSAGDDEVRLRWCAEPRVFEHGSQEATDHDGTELHDRVPG